MAHQESSLIDFISIIKIYKQQNLIISAPDNLKCTLCKGLLVEAVQTDCGCRYCKECIDRQLKNGLMKCEGESEDCKVPVKSYIHDKATNREVSTLKVECYNKGCTFTDKLKDMHSHLIVCEYRRTQCKLCRDLLLESEMPTHLTSKCSMRKVACQFCKGEFTEEQLNNTHLHEQSEELCSKYLGFCPYGCEVTDKVNLLSHRSKCTKKPNNCPFHVFGCKRVVQMSDMNGHLQTESYQHSKMMTEQHNELLKTIEELKSTIEKLRLENETMKIQLMTNKSDLENKLTQMDRNVPKHQPSAVQRIDTVFRNGRYVWKINDFSKLKDNAMKGINISILSDPFYTAEFGYKMCLKIYPYGDGMGKGTHLSVFFVLMRGEYDSLQVWPFMNKVILTILENFAKTTNHSDTFKPDARSICYQQPEDEYNIASGSPKFISFTDLNKFLKHDTLYIQIVVPS